MCVPREEGNDQKPELRDETDVRQPDGEQPRGPTSFFTDGRRRQRDPRSLSGWYRHVVGLEGLPGLPAIRDTERSQGAQEVPGPSTSTGQTPELQRRRRRQQWRWVTTRQEEEESEVPRRRSPLRRVVDETGEGGQRGVHRAPEATPSSTTSENEGRDSDRDQPSTSAHLRQSQHHDNGGACP